MNDDKMGRDPEPYNQLILFSNIREPSVTICPLAELLEAQIQWLGEALPRSPNHHDASYVYPIGAAVRDKGDKTAHPGAWPLFEEFRH